jgi:predicted phosphodiesterase
MEELPALIFPDTHTPQEGPSVPLTTFDDAWAQWERTIGLVQDRYRGPKQQTIGPREKILVIPDLHVPFHDEGLLAETCVREQDADRVVCIGDIGDAYALSRFLKYESVGFDEEWAQVTVVLQALSERFPQVDIIVGNHDARLEKQLLSHLTTDMIQAVRVMTGGTLCPLTALAKRYENVRIAKHVTPDGRIVEWFTAIGDAWLGHPERFSRVPGSAARAVEEWLSDHERALGLERYPLIVMGHTHQMLWMPWRAGQLVIECGCLCQTQGYMLSPRIGGRPQRRGYVTFEQENGHTDLQSVRVVWLDA